MNIKFQIVTEPPRHMEETWPSKFIVIPRLGELVSAKSGFRMKVSEVTHAEEDVPRQLTSCQLITIVLSKK